MVVLSAAFVALMVFVVRPLLGRAWARSACTGALSKEHVAVVLAVLLVVGAGRLN